MMDVSHSPRTKGAVEGRTSSRPGAEVLRDRRPRAAGLVQPSHHAAATPRPARRRRRADRDREDRASRSRSPSASTLAESRPRSSPRIRGQVYRGLDIGTAKATPRGARARRASRDRPRRPRPDVHRRRLPSPRAGRPRGARRTGRCRHPRRRHRVLAAGGLRRASTPGHCPGIRRSAHSSRRTSRRTAWPRLRAAWRARAPRWRHARTCATLAASCARWRSPRSRAMRPCRSPWATPPRCSDCSWPWSWPSTAAGSQRRARAQFEAGLVEEARTLRERWDPDAAVLLGHRVPRGLGATWTANMHARGGGRADAQHNIAFAKRQRTWFRAERSLELVDAYDGHSRRAIDGRAWPALTGLHRPTAILTGARYPCGCAMSPRDPIDLSPPVEKAFLIAVDTGDDPGWTAEDSLARARRARRHRGRGGGGRGVAEPPPHRPQLVRGQGQGRGARCRPSRRRASRSSSPTTSSARPSRSPSRACSTPRSSTAAA